MKTKTLLLAFTFISLMLNAQVVYISTIAGTGAANYSGDNGPAVSAKLNVPFGMSFDAVGNLYFADNGNNVIRKIDATTGIITTIAGVYYLYTGSTWYYGGDGHAADSAFIASPFGIALDTAGNIYFSDNLNNVIRKVTVSTGIITTVAGNSTLLYMPYAFSGDGGPATSAELNNPWGVAVDKAGNIYIADNSYNVIRKVTASTGIITTVAGNGIAGYYGDNGQADNAQLNAPSGVSLDTAGNLYISDNGNNVIRKINALSGIITTVAGNGNAGYSGDNGLAISAKIHDPSLGVAFDPAGNFYIADDANNVIRKVTVSTGIITTIAGTGANGYSGDNGPATLAKFNGPEGVAVDAHGNIYISDENNVIRKINEVFIDTVPATPEAIYGSTTVCKGTYIIYSVDSVAGATNYTWTLPGGWIGSSTTNSIIALADSSGTITVTANNSVGSSAPQSVYVTVNTVNTSVSQSGATLTANATSAAYLWINCNSNIPVQGDTIQSFTAITTGSYAVVITQNTCVDTSACFPVVIVIDTVPATPQAIHGSTTVCKGTYIIYSVDSVSGATSYTWTLPGGWVGASTTNSIIALADSSGTITVTANNSVGSSAPQSVYVTVNTVNTSVTQSGATLTATATSATYIWINCNGNIPVQAETNQSYTASISGSYAVVVTQNGCVDTSNCFTANVGCSTTITGADLPHTGLSIMLVVDTVTNVPLGIPSIAQNWDYSMLTISYPKFAVYYSTAATPYASVFTTSNIDTYGPGNLYGTLFGGAPVVSSDNGYIFWKSDTTGFWETGFRADGGTYAGINVKDVPKELIIGAPAVYGSVFNNTARWELPMNLNAADVDTFYVRNIKKTITADACGSITTPYGAYSNILREHEYVISFDSIYAKVGSFVATAIEFKRDTLNNYMYLANGVGYPVCIVHCDKNNQVLDVEYYAGIYTDIDKFTLGGNKITVFPNPANDKITISIDKTNAFDNSDIAIYDIQGRLILKQSIVNANVEVNITTFAKGMYIVKVNNNNNITVSKFVKE